MFLDKFVVFLSKKEVVCSKKEADRNARFKIKQVAISRYSASSFAYVLKSRGYFHRKQN